MDFVCEDLPQYGLPLVPPTAPDYPALLNDIQRRLGQMVNAADQPTSAILLNKSARSIASLTVVWRFETAGGRSFRHAYSMLSKPALLLPFSELPQSLKIRAYWDTILSGSKRYLAESGIAGFNTDVRPPASDEQWSEDGGGGVGSVSGWGTWNGAHTPAGDPVERIVLVLDGVFFQDGGFVGPNREKLFEQTVTDAQAHQLIGRIARDGHNKGTDPAQILAQIEKTTGPAPQSPGPIGPNPTVDDFRQWALEKLAFEFHIYRTLGKMTAERVVYTTMAWTDAVVPNFRRARM
jgi:hypothetical protein